MPLCKCAVGGRYSETLCLENARGVKVGIEATEDPSRPNDSMSSGMVTELGVRNVSDKRDREVMSTGDTDRT